MIAPKAQSDRAPSFLVVGAGRAGSTALAQGLRTNPHVFLTSPKEPHYFAYHGQRLQFSGPGDADSINAVGVTDEKAYLALYEDAGGATVLGDAAVTTLFEHEHAIPEIKRLAPAARIVIVLREPVSRAFSAFSYMRRDGLEPEVDFLEAFRDSARRAREGWQPIWQYEQMGHYPDAVAAFLDAFGDEQVKVVFHEDLEERYTEVVKDVLRHIGAPPEAGEAEGVSRVNSSGEPRSRLLLGLTAAARRRPWVRAAVRRVTTYDSREAVRRATMVRSVVGPADYPEVAATYVDDLPRLRAVLGERDVPPWLRP